MIHIYNNKINNFKLTIEAPTPEIANEVLEGITTIAAMESMKWSLIEK